MNWPNVLTFSRIGFAIVLVFLLLANSLIAYIFAAFIFFIASLTDFYDGYLAKKLGQISDFGKIMDPIADKVLMLSVFFVLAYIGIITWWMVLLIAFREILVTVDRLWSMYQGKVLAAEKAGKIKTFFQMITVSLILIYLILKQAGSDIGWFHGVQDLYLNGIQVLMFITVFLTIGSAASYFQSKIKGFSL